MLQSKAAWHDFVELIIEKKYHDINDAKGLGLGTGKTRTAKSLSISTGLKRKVTLIMLHYILWLDRHEVLYIVNQQSTLH